MLGAVSGLSPYYGYYKNLTNNTERTQNTQNASGVWTAQKAAQPETPVQPVRPVTAVDPDAAQLTSLGLARGDAADLAEMSVRQRIQPYEGEQNYATASASMPAGRVMAASTALPQDYLRLADANSRLADAENQANGYGPDAAEEAVRMRITPYGEEDGQKLPGLPGNNAAGAEQAKAAGQSEEASDVKSPQEVMEESECQTCKERKYQDGSDDPGVSFKTPTEISPDQAASAVRGHEMEHVYREQAAAERDGRKVVSQSVTMHTAICPECGRVYVSGGTTRTTTKADNSQQQAEQQQQQQQRQPFAAAA